MAAKTIDFPASPLLVEDLARVLRQYAEAAYPVGGSECGQVAREALLNVVEALQRSLAQGETASISRRLRAQLRAAVNYEQQLAVMQQASFAARAAVINTILDGQPVTAEQYRQAGHTDHAKTL